MKGARGGKTARRATPIKIHSPRAQRVQQFAAPDPDAWKVCLRTAIGWAHRRPHRGCPFVEFEGKLILAPELAAFRDKLATEEAGP